MSNQEVAALSLLLTFLLGIAIWVSGCRSQAGKEYRKTFSVEPGTVLKIYNKNGNIDVSSWDRDYVEVDAKSNFFKNLLKEPSIDISTGKEFVVRTLNSMNLRITVPKGVLITRVENSKGKINVKNVSGDVDVETSTGEIQIHRVDGFVKAETNIGKINVENVSGDVNAKTSTGEIEIHGVNGFVKAETNIGKINVENVSGDVDAKTSTGEIDIHGVNGFVKADTNIGKIYITGVSGLYEVRTDKGDISVEVPAIRDNLEIKSRYGSITAFLSPNIAAQLEASTSNGNITYKDLPITVTQSSKTMMTGRLGEGSGRINITTSMGSITLKKLF
jgi:DUF4097 and DUF4098 domain-containing protein YvlB